MRLLSVYLILRESFEMYSCFLILYDSRVVNEAIDPKITKFE